MPAPLDLNSLVREVLELYQEGAVKVNATLDPLLPHIQADANQLRQVLHNLIKNAAEALTEKVGGGGTAPADTSAICITVTTRLSRHGVQLAVSDNGPGFPAQILTHAFEPYVTTKPKGTGLGLAIVQKIIDDHGGTITLANRPAARGWSRSKRAITLTSKFTSRRHSGIITPMSQILVIDDEVGIRELLSEILTDEGHDVATAENAATARAWRDARRPDLVLLDIWMPDTDGVTLLKEWAANGQLNMPVVMMSGHATIETAVEATKIGAVGFLEKPIGMQKLLASVKQALERGPRQSGALSLAAFPRSAPLEGSAPSPRTNRGQEPLPAAACAGEFHCRTGGAHPAAGRQDLDRPEP